MFERFYRSTSARAMPGSGLGLAIVKQVVVKHGGMIRIGQTVPGGEPPGTTFFVLLPGSPTSSSYRSSSTHGEISAPNGEVDVQAGDQVGAGHGNASAVPSVISVDSK